MSLKQIVVDASAYYLLGYNSSHADSDGKFHEINVKVKRPGVQVRHRKGYWALKPEEAARVADAGSAESRQRGRVGIEKTATPRSRIVRTWLGTERGDNGTTRVTFVWEPTPQPGRELREGDRRRRVTLTRLECRWPDLPRPRTRERCAVASAAAGARVSFNAKPGRVQLRDCRSKARAPRSSTAKCATSSIPDLTSPQTTFGTPSLFRARTRPELQRLKTDAAPVPVVAREFSRTDRLLVRVPVYGPAGSTPVAEGDAPESRRSAHVRAPRHRQDPARGFSQVELPLSNLTAGRVRGSAFGHERGRRCDGNRGVPHHPLSHAQASSSSLLARHRPPVLAPRGGAPADARLVRIDAVATDSARARGHRSSFGRLRSRRRRRVP